MYSLSNDNLASLPIKFQGITEIIQILLAYVDCSIEWHATLD